MTIDGSTFPNQMAAAAEDRPHLIAALTRFAWGTRRYLWVSTVFGFIVAVLDTIALYLLDIPAPLLWGLLAFLTNYIPNIGFIIGLIPPAILGLLEGGPSKMLAVIAVYSILNVIIQSGHPAQGRRRRGGTVHDPDLRVPGVLGVGARPAGRAAGDPAEPAGQGAAHRRRPGQPVDGAAGVQQAGSAHRATT